MNKKNKTVIPVICFFVFILANPIFAKTPVFEVVEKVFFTGKKFIVLGSIDGTWIGNRIGSGVAYISEDGVTFRKIPVKAERVPFRVGASDGERILIAGDSIVQEDGFKHYSVMFLSKDGGRSWREVPGVYGEKVAGKPAFMDTFMVNQLLFQNGYFTAVTSDGAIYISSNGASWRKIKMSHDEPHGAALLNRTMVIWGASGLLCIGRGEKWESVKVNDINSINSLVYEDGMYTGFGSYDCCYGEVPGSIKYYQIESRDLKKWNLYRIPEFPAAVIKVKTAGHSFIGISGKNIISGKPGEKSVVIRKGDEEMAGICKGKGIFLAAGSKGLLIYSRDGKEWQNAEPK